MKGREGKERKGERERERREEKKTIPGTLHPHIRFPREEGRHRREIILLPHSALLIISFSSFFFLHFGLFCFIFLFWLPQYHLECNGGRKY